jgi:hypothetical protein
VLDARCGIKTDTCHSRIIPHPGSRIDYHSTDDQFR